MSLDAQNHAVLSQSPSLEQTSPKESTTPKRDESVLTIDDCLNRIGFGRFQVFLFVISGITYSADAMTIVCLSLITPMVKEKWRIPGIIEAAIVGVAFFGIMVGVVFWGWLCDRLGRKVSFFGVSTFTLIGGGLAGLSQNWWMLSIFYFFAGFGVGSAPLTLAVLSEFLPAKGRGIKLNLFQASWTVGTCFEACLGWIVVPRLGWSWLPLFTVAPLILVLACAFCLPESPRFLLSHGPLPARNGDKAVELMRRAARINRTADRLPAELILVARAPTANATAESSPDSENFDMQRKPLMPALGSIQDSAADSTVSSVDAQTHTSARRAKSGTSYLDLMQRKYRRSTVLLAAIWFCVNMVYYGIIFLTPQFFDTKKMNRYLITLICSAAEFPGLLLCTVLIDVIGRRPTQVLGMALCGTASVLLIIPIHSTIARTIFIMAARCFVLGSFDTTVVYTPEVYPLSMRAKAVGLCSGVARISGIMSPFLPYVLSGIKPWIPLVIFAVLSFASAVCAIFLPLETKGLVLSDVDDAEPAPASAPADAKSPTSPLEAGAPESFSPGHEKEPLLSPV